MKNKNSNIYIIILSAGRASAPNCKIKNQRRQPRAVPAVSDPPSARALPWEAQGVLEHLSKNTPLTQTKAAPPGSEL